jgi:hypothetical protein
MLEFVVFALATWRLSSLLSAEDGPWGMFAELRRFMGVRYDDHSIPYGTTMPSKLLACVWCLSVWVGAFWALLWWLWPGVSFWLAAPLALSAGAIVVEKITAD